MNALVTVISCLFDVKFCVRIKLSLFKVSLSVSVLHDLCITTRMHSHCVTDTCQHVQLYDEGVLVLRAAGLGLHVGTMIAF